MSAPVLPAPGPPRIARKCRLPLILALTVCATAGLAEGYQCRGITPDWHLEFDSKTARFRFPATTEMEVMLTTTPDGQDWPRALTLIGDRDTAIVLLEPLACNGMPFRALVMTQRGQSPILLTGCCTAAP